MDVLPWDGCVSLYECFNEMSEWMDTGFLSLFCSFAAEMSVQAPLLAANRSSFHWLDYDLRPACMSSCVCGSRNDRNESALIHNLLPLFFSIWFLENRLPRSSHCSLRGHQGITSQKAKCFRVIDCIFLSISCHHSVCAFDCVLSDLSVIPLVCAFTFFSLMPASCVRLFSEILPLLPAVTDHLTLTMTWGQDLTQLSGLSESGKVGMNSNWSRVRDGKKIKLGAFRIRGEEEDDDDAVVGTDRLLHLVL